MKRRFRSFLFVMLLMGLAGVFSEEACAAFSFSVAPRRGGRHIRFEQSAPGTFLQNEEVTLSVETDEAAQYHILQTLYQPLTNEFGQTIPQDAFIVFSPSEPMGTLRTKLETPITLGQKPIYVSNEGGDSDSFLLVFNARVPENQAGGIYHTQLTFTAEPVTPKAGVSPQVVTLDVRVEIRPVFKMTLRSRKGASDLHFDRISKERPAASEILKIEIQSNAGKSYRIFQELTEPVFSGEGTVLDESAVSFIASGGSKGTLAAGGSSTPLVQAPALLYTSDETGSGDVMELEYALAPPPAQKAGIYAGNLSFKVESGSPLVPSEVINVPIRIEIESIFYLEVELKEGTGLHFGVFRTGEEKTERQTVLTVHSNLGKPYQISQFVTRKFTNPEGKTLPLERFMFHGAEVKSGILAASSPTSVLEGESAVFTSDSQGSPEKIVLTYTLAVPKEARAGLYSSELKYSITAL